MTTSRARQAAIDRAAVRKRIQLAAEAARVLDRLGDAELSVTEVKVVCGDLTEYAVRQSLLRLVDTGAVLVRHVTRPYGRSVGRLAMCVYRRAAAPLRLDWGSSGRADHGDLIREGLGQRDHAEVMRRIAAIRAEKDAERERTRWDGPHADRWTPPEVPYPLITSRRH